MRCVEVLLHLVDGAPRDALDASLVKEGGNISRALPGSAIRIAHGAAHHRDDVALANASVSALDDLVATGLPPAHAPVAVTSFDAVLELRVAMDVDADLVIDVLHGLVTRLGEAVDPARSAAVMGTDYVLIDGGGPVQLFYCLRRVPEMSRAAFNDYWLHQLTKHTSKTPGKTGYRQIHSDPALTRRAAAAMGVSIDTFDGVALEWYPDFEGLLTATKWAGGTPDVVEAETRMIDFEASRAMLTYSLDGAT